MGLALSVPLIAGQIIPIVGAIVALAVLLVVARIVFSLAWRLVVIGAVVFGLLWLLRAVDSLRPALS